MEIAAKFVDELGELCEDVKPKNSRIEWLKKNIFKPLGASHHVGETYEVRIREETRKQFNQEKARSFLTPEQFEACFEDSKVVYVEPRRKEAASNLAELLKATIKAKAKKVKREKGSKRRAA